MASSQISLSFKSFDPLHAPSAVTKTRASQSRIRSASESAENPANCKNYGVLEKDLSLSLRNTNCFICIQVSNYIPYQQL